MISRPKNGWCEFTLDSFKGTPSYLTDVPVDLLDAFINYFKIGYGVVAFDEEGTSFTLVLERYNSNIFIIEEREERLLHIFDNLFIKDLVNDLIQDIEKDIDNWSDFITSDAMDDVIKHEESILQRISVLKELIKINCIERLG